MFQSTLLALDISDPNINPMAKISNVTDISQVIIPTLFIGASLIFLFMLLWGGLTYITSSGDAEKVKKAQRIITSAIAGLLVVISAFLIVNIVRYVLGVQGTFGV